MDPKLASALWNLSELLFQAGREAERSDALLIRALACGLPDAARQVIARATSLRRSGAAARSAKLVDAALSARPEEPELLLLRGRARLDQQDCAGALADFQGAVERWPQSALAHASAGLASLCLGDEAAARTSFQRSLELDPNQPELRQALAQPP